MQSDSLKVRFGQIKDPHPWKDSGSNYKIIRVVVNVVFLLLEVVNQSGNERDPISTGYGGADSLKKLRQQQVFLHCTTL